MDNIFKDAKFGDKFRTRNGDLAILVELPYDKESEHSRYTLYVNAYNSTYHFYYRKNGMHEEKESVFDIVSKYDDYQSEHFKFNVGDIVIWMKHKAMIHSVIDDEKYHIVFDDMIDDSSDETQKNNYEIVPGNELKLLVKYSYKFKPFEKVLVKQTEEQEWSPHIFASYINNCWCPYKTIDDCEWKYCIPYKGNEHLLKNDNDK